MATPSNESPHDFCIHCGARVPPLRGEGICPKCPTPPQRAVTTDLFKNVDIRLGKEHLIVQADHGFLAGLTLMHGYTMARYRAGVLTNLHDGQVTPAHLWQKPGQWLTYMDWTGKEIMS